MCIRDRVKFERVHGHITAAAGAGVHVAGLRGDGDVAAVVGGDARAVHVDGAVRGDGNAAAAGGENSLGKIRVAERGELVAHVQRAADVQIDSAEQALVGDGGRGHGEIAGGGDVEIRAVGRDRRERGIRREDGNAAGNAEVNFVGRDIERARPGERESLITERGGQAVAGKFCNHSLPTGQLTVCLLYTSRCV